jgi:hypothetical protein
MMAAERKMPEASKRMADAEAAGYLTISKGQPYTNAFVARWRAWCVSQGRPAIHAVVSDHKARVVAVFHHIGVIDPSQAREIAATLQGVEGCAGLPVRFFGGEYEYGGKGVVVRRTPEIEAECPPEAVAEVAGLLSDRILDAAR